MRRQTIDWLETKILDSHLNEHSLRRFVAHFVWRAIVATDAVVVLVHVVLDALHLLPYPLTDALLVGLSVSTLTAGVVGFLLAYYIGCAIRELSISRGEFARLSATDALSGLLNRRSFFAVLETAETGSKFVIFDIDRFKAINDTYGHSIGDQVICDVGRVLSRSFAPAAFAIARIGGEEFAVLLSAKSSHQHRDMIEAAREQVAAAVTVSETRDINVTISGGFADVIATRSALDTYKAADRALYVAKAAGRNRIVDERELSNANLAVVTAPCDLKIAS